MTDYHRILVTGIIQGVGFRPFIYKTARELGLCGDVCNTEQGVEINISGDPEKLERFMEALENDAPPASSIDSVKVLQTSPFESRDFEIIGSRVSGEREVLISPDLGTCEDCLRELFDSGDRRYRYPFINCTNCGPRFTIIENTPYDRFYTSMASFEMCDECRREYEDPASRRFHAQPNACPNCGPRLFLVDKSGEEMPGEAVEETARLIRDGNIIAVKGLGGFHLACDATSDEAVEKLRLRKNRYGKPLAVMVVDLEQAKRYCHISDKESLLMSSPKRPIVLLGEKPGSPISRSVARGLKHQGLFLPYTPLHYLLLDAAKMPLVMTSGNISGEPIATGNTEAVDRLSTIADYFLLNDRDILVRYDDSVTRVFKGAEYPLRRARGYAPYPLRLSSPSEVEVLALGPELKNSFCVLRGDRAFMGQHIGDMGNALAMDHFEQALETVIRLFSLKPHMVACDMHPEYITTQIAADYGLPVTRIQHHHAHIAGCMADNGFEGEVIGVAWDGTGYGEDGTVWGGEFLYCSGGEYERLAHLFQYRMPGSDACIWKIYRMAAGILSEILGSPQEALSRLDELVGIDEAEKQAIAFQLTNKVNSPLTSSSGRLFDAAAALMGLRRNADYEGQAACELEALASGSTESYPFEIMGGEGPLVIDTRPLFKDILDDILSGVEKPLIAGKFHHTMAVLIARTALKLSRDTGIRTVALSGGVFQNELLTGKVVDMLEDAGLQLLLHRRVPCNDGGVALGQAVIAMERCKAHTFESDLKADVDRGYRFKPRRPGRNGPVHV